MKRQCKIFGIGLNKTGTTTLGECLKVLGFKHQSWSEDLLRDLIKHNDLRKIYQTVDAFDSFEDLPWPLVYKQLDQKFPNSKFILTTRLSPEKWVNSQQKHLERKTPFNKCTKMTYNSFYPYKNPENFINFYKQHNAEVIEYFKDRPNDLVILNWEKGDGWNELCSFLKLPVPELTFPHQNASHDHKKTSYYRFINKIISQFFH